MKSTAKKVITYISGLLLIVLIDGYLEGPPGANRVLMKLWRYQHLSNRLTPLMYDENTRLDSVVVIPPMEVQLNFTLVKYLKEDIDTAIAIAKRRPLLVKDIKSSELFTKNNVTVIDRYFDKESNYVFSVKVTPEDMKNLYFEQFLERYNKK